jgi:hypothetical protein
MLGRVVIAIALTGCAAGPSALPAAHPASPAAPVGRLAPAPPSLRARVVVYPDVPAIRTVAPVDHSHHHHGS